MDDNDMEFHSLRDSGQGQTLFDRRSQLFHVC